MITTADALEVMTIVAACHHRTAPRMDDREVTLVTAKTWADLFNEFRLELADLIAAVKKRAARNEIAPEPAEIIQFARDIRNERDARRGPSAEYEALCEAKGELSEAELKFNQEKLARMIAPVAASKAVPALPHQEAM